VRILQVHTHYRETGGEDVVVQAEAALLRRAGHEVLQHQVENPRRAVAAAAALAAAPWNPAAARDLRRMAERVRPDVVHVHNTWFALSPAVLPAFGRAGVPVVMTLHNYRLLCANGLLFRDGHPCEDCVGSHPWHGVRHGCYRGSAAQSIPVAATIALHRRRRTWDRDVELFLALNEFSRALFVRGGLPPDRILVKPNSVPDPGMRTVPAERSSTVLVVGRLADQKGVHLLLEAWRRFANRSLELVVVGDGPARADLERLGVPGVRFAGRLAPEQVRELMLAGRALAFPSRSYEGQPMVVLEALAAGLPVLASDLGGLPELLRPTGAGWLIPPGDAAGWTGALRGLAQTAPVVQASAAALRLYQQVFTEERAARTLEDAYERARARQL